MRGKRNKIFVDRVYYTDEENVDKINNKHVVRDIKNVSDYLRAVEMILSNYYMPRRGDLKIKQYENIFSDSNGKELCELTKNGLFFRGESKEHEFVIPGIYRDARWMINEKEIVSENIIYAPEELKKANSNFDILTLIQHYGGSTRILDITSNALVALYFAVTGNNNEDGVVYLFSGNDYREILTPNDTPVAVKAALSQLSFEQKEFLAHTFNQVEDKNKEIREYVEVNGIADEFDAINTLYNVFMRDNMSTSVKIKIRDLFGVNIVNPIKMDRRVIQQSGAFIIFGLEDISSAKTRAEEVIKDDMDIKKHQIDIKKLNITTQDDMTQIMKIEKDIKEKKEHIWYNCLEQVAQEEAYFLLDDLEFMYSPEVFLGYKNIREGAARIKIKSKFKKAIISELDMLGIDESKIYPDFAHKTRVINEKFLML